MPINPIVHVDFAAADPSVTSKFYADLFGWEVTYHEEFNYHVFAAAPGPGGGFVAEGGPGGYKPGEVVVYTSTDDIDATLLRAEELGAKILAPKMEIPGVGWMGMFADPDGRRFGLFTSGAPAS